MGRNGTFELLRHMFIFFFSMAHDGIYYKEEVLLHRHGISTNIH